MANPKLTLYAALKAAGIPLDSHESDLYAKVTLESRQIVQDAIERGAFHGNPIVFVNQQDGTLWYDFPFMYAPFWEVKQLRERAISRAKGLVLLVFVVAGLSASACGNPLAPSCVSPVTAAPVGPGQLPSSHNAIGLSVCPQGAH